MHSLKSQVWFISSWGYCQIKTIETLESISGAKKQKDFFLMWVCVFYFCGKIFPKCQWETAKVLILEAELLIH